MSRICKPQWRPWDNIGRPPATQDHVTVSSLPMSASRIAALSSVLIGAAAPALAGDLSVQVLDRHGRNLADAVVLVESANRQGAALPTLDAVIVQENLRFAPNVALVSVGAKAVFQNMDRWDHHVILGAMSPAGDYVDHSATTQLRLPARVKGTGAPAEAKVISRAGPHLLGCHLHASMRGYVYAADTPWAGVTAADGKVLIRQVPDGSIKVKVWHPNQLLETPPTNASVGPAMNALTIKTQVTPPLQKQSRSEEIYYE